MRLANKFTKPSNCMLRSFLAFLMRIYALFTKNHHQQFHSGFVHDNIFLCSIFQSDTKTRVRSCIHLKWMKPLFYSSVTTKSQPNMNQNVWAVIVSGVAVASFHTYGTLFPLWFRNTKLLCSHFNLMYFYRCSER